MAEMSIGKQKLIQSIEWSFIPEQCPRWLTDGSAKTRHGLKLWIAWQMIVRYQKQIRLGTRPTTKFVENYKEAREHFRSLGGEDEFARHGITFLDERNPWNPNRPKRKKLDTHEEA